VRGGTRAQRGEKFPFRSSNKMVRILGPNRERSPGPNWPQSGARGDQLGAIALRLGRLCLVHTAHCIQSTVHNTQPAYAQRTVVGPVQWSGARPPAQRGSSKGASYARSRIKRLPGPPETCPERPQRHSLLGKPSQLPPASCSPAPDVRPDTWGTQRREGQKRRKWSKWQKWPPRVAGRGDRPDRPRVFEECRRPSLGLGARASERTRLSFGALQMDWADNWAKNWPGRASLGGRQVAANWAQKRKKEEKKLVGVQQLALAETVAGSFRPH